MFGLDSQQFSAVLVVLFYVLANGTLYVYNTLIHRLPVNQQARLQEFAQIGVKAAQYVGSNNTVQDAIKKVEDLCRQFNVNFDLTTATHFVHAALQELKTVVPSTIPIANAVDSAATWLNDVSQQQQPIPLFPQGLPTIPQSMPGSGTTQ